MVKKNIYFFTQKYNNTLYTVIHIIYMYVIRNKQCSNDCLQTVYSSLSQTVAKGPEYNFHVFTVVHVCTGTLYLAFHFSIHP